MADIAFLLLIFFMLIVYEPDRTQLDLPDSTVRKGSETEAAIVIVTPAEGTPSGVTLRFTDGQSESELIPGFGAVQAEAVALLASNRDIVFKIKADGAVPARAVTRVFDALIGAGAGKVLMLTDPAQPDASRP